MCVHVNEKSSKTKNSGIKELEIKIQNKRILSNLIAKVSVNEYHPDTYCVTIHSTYMYRLISLVSHL